ncbi:MAG: lipoate--protein ligase family protein [Phycisphaerae bacterium]|nr:lipoate--protein ligase family protein [Phycisphaerae bacterium]
MTDPLRLLIDPPLDGPTNMARDEALLEGVGAGSSPLTLRCYRWCEPTISLGYFQPYAEFEAFCRDDRRLPVVRRTTGGGAILHDRELTYSLIVPVGHRLIAGGATGLYCRMHDAIVEVVRSLGLPAGRRGEVVEGDRERGEAFFCFARRHSLDVVVGQLKLAGSAQRRTSQAVLQHGSVILQAAHEAQPSAALAETGGAGFEELARGVSDRFARDNDLSLAPEPWRPEELERAKAHESRYNSAAWTRRC